MAARLNCRGLRDPMSSANRNGAGGSAPLRGNKFAISSNDAPNNLKPALAQAGKASSGEFSPITFGKRKQSAGRKRAAPRRASDAVRIVAVYSGRDCLGRVEIEEDGSARAFDHAGYAVGTFENATAAAASLPEPAPRRGRV